MRFYTHETEEVFRRDSATCQLCRRGPSREAANLPRKGDCFITSAYSPCFHRVAHGKRVVCRPACEGRPGRSPCDKSPPALIRCCRIQTRHGRSAVGETRLAVNQTRTSARLTTMRNDGRLHTGAGQGDRLSCLRGLIAHSGTHHPGQMSKRSGYNNSLSSSWNCEGNQGRADNEHVQQVRRDGQGRGGRDGV